MAPSPKPRPIVRRCSDGVVVVVRRDGRPRNGLIMRWWQRAGGRVTGPVHKRAGRRGLRAAGALPHRGEARTMPRVFSAESWLLRVGRRPVAWMTLCTLRKRIARSSVCVA